MSDPNNVPMPRQEQPAVQQGDTTQPAYQATPQYQVPQTPVYGQPTQPYAQQGNTYAAYAQQTAAPTVPLDQPHYGCSFTEAFVRFWKKYATFKGRASRSEFWWWILCSLLISLAIGVVFGILKAIFPGGNSGIMHMSLSLDSTSLYTTGGSGSSNSALGTLQNIVTIMWWLATIVPTIALTVRRLHDINKPGWWLAIYYGAQVLLTVVMIVVALVAIASAASSYYYSYRYGYDRSDMISAVVTGSGGVLICGILMLALWIAYIVFMALPSKPEGARFDAVTTDYTPGAYAAPAGYAAPTTPAAPGTSMPATPAAAYEQPAAAPATPAAPTAPSEEYSQPEQPAADNNVQPPQQDQQ